MIITIIILIVFNVLSNTHYTVIISLILSSMTFSFHDSLRSVVRALLSHQCGLGLIPRLGIIRGLSLLALYATLGGFSHGFSGFPLSSKPKFDLI